MIYHLAHDLVVIVSHHKAAPTDLTSDHISFPTMSKAEVRAELRDKTTTGLSKDDSKAGSQHNYRFHSKRVGDC